jgi:hypothetical protein
MHIISPKIQESILCLDLSDSGVEKLNLIAKANKEEYASGEPFKHIVIDGLFPDELLEDILLETQELNHTIEKIFFGSTKKFATSNLQLMGPTTSRLLLDLNSSQFLSFLETLTGVSSLIPDPHYEGGGVHETISGGFLKIHTDFNWHKRLKLDRRVNILIYLNKDWHEEWGGFLELWDRSMLTKKHIKISPLFNRTVIFSTTDFTYHGHPDPLQCPDQISRKSLALYYYSAGRPPKEVKNKRRVGTEYVERPGEKLQIPKSRYLLLKKMIPSRLIDLFRRIRNYR